MVLFNLSTCIARSGVAQPFQRYRIEYKPNGQSFLVDRRVGTLRESEVQAEFLDEAIARFVEETVGDTDDEDMMDTEAAGDFKRGRIVYTQGGYG